VWSQRANRFAAYKLHLEMRKNQRNIYMAANGTQFHFVVLINDFRALQQFPPQNEQKSGADRKRTAN